MLRNPLYKIFAREVFQPKNQTYKAVPDNPKEKCFQTINDNNKKKIK